VNNCTAKIYGIATSCSRQMYIVQYYRLTYSAATAVLLVVTSSAR